MNMPLVRPFPKPGPLMTQAYYDLYRAETADKPEQVADLGPLDELPRPWDLPTVADPEMRAEVWQWLDAVVAWINRECLWETGDLVPPCWAQHPHLVHELAVVADQRRQAGAAFRSDAMEDWQRYCLPTFIDRVRSRYRGFCDEGHQPAPGTARITRYESDALRRRRRDCHQGDIAAALPMRPVTGGLDEGSRRLQIVGGLVIDPQTGEIRD